jgi:hypothetical protein
MGVVGVVAHSRSKPLAAHTSTPNGRFPRRLGTDAASPHVRVAQAGIVPGSAGSGPLAVSGCGDGTAAGFHVPFPVRAARRRICPRRGTLPPAGPARARAKRIAQRGTRTEPARRSGVVRNWLRM